MNTPAPSTSSDNVDAERPSNTKAHATMACGTCRRRKSRCDEQQPRCGLCQRLNLHCLYQEPKPTKKDNTLMLILRTLDSLNLKMDRVLSPEPEETLLSLNRQNAIDDSAQGTITNMIRQSNQQETATNDITMSCAPDSRAASQESGISPQNISLQSFDVPVRHTKETQSLLAWPAVQALLECEGVNLSKWDGHCQGTESWLISISKDFPKMAIDPPINILYSEFGVQIAQSSHSLHLSKRHIESLCAAYFQSFHYTYPILDYHQFYNILLPQVCGQSFSDANEGSALVLLVLAIGSVARESATGDSFVDEAGRETGVRGGTILRPPGHGFLSEAKRRLGLELTSWNLNSLQCCILFSIYYAQLSRNLEFWRMVIMGCTICKSLVKRTVNWSTVESDQLARCFWICCIFEGGLTGEMGFEVPAITELEDSVPLPLFLSDFTDQDTKSNIDLFIEYHFLAQITLRTLINRARQATQETRNLLSIAKKDWMSRSMFEELLRQLENWRAHLPAAIAWSDHRMNDTGLSSDEYKEATVPLDPASPGMLDFRIILNACLRTRYKYAEYIIWKPYLFRVLHSPQDPAKHNIEGCRKAFKACTLWPLTFATFRSQRRLIPHIYEYTHTFFGILILMHVCSFNHFLGPILHSTPDDAASPSAPAVSISLCLSWIRDMKVVHPLARWCWELLRVIYKDHELVRELEE